MAEGIQVAITGDAEVTAALRRLLAAVDDPHQVLDQIGALLESNTHQRFDTKSDPAGNAWAPWSPTTIAAYNRADIVKSKGGGGHEVKRGHSLLIASGGMRDSLSHLVSGDTVVVGFGKPQALYHELGAPTNRMPRRGLLMADPEAGTLGAADTAEILDLVRNYVSGAI